VTGPVTDNFYAILYGDVTGNWQPASLFSSASGDSSVPEERTAALTDQRLTREMSGRPAQRNRRRPTAGPAELSLSESTKPLKTGERRAITVNIGVSDGILGLDLRLGYDPSVLSIVGVETTGIGSGFNVVGNNGGNEYLIAAYGLAPLVGSGSLLTITVEARADVSGRSPLTITGKANEGGVPLRVLERARKTNARRAN